MVKKDRETGIWQLTSKEKNVNFRKDVLIKYLGGCIIMKKRIVAVMLTAIMAVVPMAAYASETETETETAAAETEGASEAESETEKKVELTGLTIGVQLGTTSTATMQ